MLDSWHCKVVFDLQWRFPYTSAVSKGEASYVNLSPILITLYDGSGFRVRQNFLDSSCHRYWAPAEGGLRFSWVRRHCRRSIFYMESFPTTLLDLSISHVGQLAIIFLSHWILFDDFSICPILLRQVSMHFCYKALLDTRSLGALRAPSSSLRPFMPPDFVLRTLRALRTVCQARLRSGPMKIEHFRIWGIFL